MTNPPDTPAETWAVIARFPGYEISGDGHVRNRRTRRILRPTERRYGPAVRLHRGGQRRSRAYVSTLVDEAFGTPELEADRTGPDARRASQPRPQHADHDQAEHHDGHTDATRRRRTTPRGHRGTGRGRRRITHAHTHGHAHP